MSTQKLRLRIQDHKDGTYNSGGVILRNVDSGYYVTVPLDQMYALADALVDYIEQRDQQAA